MVGIPVDSGRQLRLLLLFFFFFFWFFWAESGGWTADVGIFPSLLLSGATQETGLDEGGGGGRQRFPQVGHHLYEGRTLGVENTLGRQSLLEFTVVPGLAARRGRDGREDTSRGTTHGDFPPQAATEERLADDQRHVLRQRLLEVGQEGGQVAALSQGDTETRGACRQVAVWRGLLGHRGPGSEQQGDQHGQHGQSVGTALLRGSPVFTSLDNINLKRVLTLLSVLGQQFGIRIQVLDKNSQIETFYGFSCW